MLSWKKRQISCAIKEKRQIACAIPEERQAACVIKKKRQIGCSITEKRHVVKKLCGTYKPPYKLFDLAYMFHDECVT